MSSNDSTGTTGTPDEPLAITLSQNGRHRTYAFAELPCPALHSELAAAFEACVGKGERALTISTVDVYWASLRRFLDFLDSFNQTPASMSEVRPAYLHEYGANQRGARSADSVGMDLQRLCRLLGQAPYGTLSRPMWDLVKSPRALAGRPQKKAVELYSLREFRAIITAARADADEIRDHFAAAERQLASFRSQPSALTDDELAAGAALDQMDRTGVVPRVGRASRLDTAQRLFVTELDMEPLTVLAAALTGLPAAAVKALPADHDVLDNGRSIALRVPDRRHGGEVTVRWTVRSDGEEALSTPGDFYRLLHRLTERGRRFSGATTLWSIWTDRGTAGPRHIDAFARTRLLDLQGWACEHGLTSDEGQPLVVTLSRLRATSLLAGEAGLADG